MWKHFSFIVFLILAINAYKLDIKIRDGESYEEHHFNSEESEEKPRRRRYDPAWYNDYFYNDDDYYQVVYDTVKNEVADANQDDLQDIDFDSIDVKMLPVVQLHETENAADLDDTISSLEELSSMLEDKHNYDRIMHSLGLKTNVHYSHRYIREAIEKHVPEINDEIISEEDEVWDTDGSTHDIERRAAKKEWNPLKGLAAKLKALQDKILKNVNKTLQGIARKEKFPFQGDCIDRDSYIIGKNNLSQKAIVASLGSEVNLSCHFCSEPESLMLEAHVWYKFERYKALENDFIIWQPKEVELDVFDNEKLNRVFVSKTHTLTIRDFQPGDLGTYFCEPYTNESDPTSLALRIKSSLGSNAMSIASAWESNNDNFLWHIDLEIDSKPRTVTTTGYIHPKPSGPHINQTMNIRLETHWTNWGECNTCGPAGERRRKGTCYVVKENKTIRANPEYLDHVLQLYPQGAPCHATMFQDIKIIKDRYDEVHVDSCNLPCATESLPNMKNMNFKPLPKPTFVQRGLSVKEKGNVTMGCVNASIGISNAWPMRWVNKTAVLSEVTLENDTANRAHIDDNFNLIITSTILADSGRFACWINNEETTRYALKVGKLPLPIIIKPSYEDMQPYLAVLGISYIIDFIIFLLLQIVQHMHRARQIPKNKASMHDLYQPGIRKSGSKVTINSSL